MIWLLMTPIAALFFAKIAWNLSLPYFLFSGRPLNPQATPRSGISLMPCVEVVLLAAAVIVAVPVSFFSEASPWTAAGVALIGTAVIIGSYVHMIVMGRTLGWVFHKLGR